MVTVKERAEVKKVIDRVAAYNTHDFHDDTHYCVHCGQSCDHVLANSLKCFGQPNVVAISHRRRPSVPDLDEEFRADDFDWNVPA